jgi:hypothetical protein
MRGSREVLGNSVVECYNASQVEDRVYSPRKRYIKIQKVQRVC